MLQAVSRKGSELELELESDVTGRRVFSKGSDVTGRLK